MTVNDIETAEPQLVDVLICDDVRLEHDGRYSLLGVYPGREIITQQLPTMLSQLAFVARFKGLEGVSELMFHFEAPDGHTVQPVQGRKIKANADGDALFVLLAAPIQISQAGVHVLKTKVGNKLFKKTFRIIQPGPHA